jgi:hypothetical protein
MRVTVEQLVERRLAEKTEVLAENLPQRHSVHHKSHMTDPGLNPGRRGGKPATNRLSYGAAKIEILVITCFEVRGACGECVHRMGIRRKRTCSVELHLMYLEHVTPEL